MLDGTGISNYLCCRQHLILLQKWLIILTGFCLVSSCNSQGDLEQNTKSRIEVKDVRGKMVQLNEPARRVIVLYQGTLDGMYMLGAEHTLVGIQHTIYTNPETFKYFSKLDPRIASKEMPAPGNWENSTSMESVVALRPDLVIIASGQTDAISMLEDMGIAVFAVSPRTNEQLFAELENIGKLTGTYPRAQELIAYTNSKLEEIRKKTEHIAEKKSVYYAWSGGRIYATSGKNSRMNECFELAGVVNACPFEMDTPNVNPESLIAWNPDLFLLWNTDPAELYKRKELAVLSAVKNKEVYVLEPPFFYDPHTLKIMYAAIVLHNISYADKQSFDSEADKKEIMFNLYGEKANNLFK